MDYVTLNTKNSTGLQSTLSERLEAIRKRPKSRFSLTAASKIVGTVMQTLSEHKMHFHTGNNIPINQRVITSTESIKSNTDLEEALEQLTPYASKYEFIAELLSLPSKRIGQITSEKNDVENLTTVLLAHKEHNNGTIDKGDITNIIKIIKLLNTQQEQSCSVVTRNSENEYLQSAHTLKRTRVEDNDNTIIIEDSDNEDEDVVIVSGPPPKKKICIVIDDDGYTQDNDVAPTISNTCSSCTLPIKNNADLLILECNHPVHKECHENWNAKRFTYAFKSWYLSSASSTRNALYKDFKTECTHLCCNKTTNRCALPFNQLKPKIDLKILKGTDNTLTPNHLLSLRDKRTDINTIEDVEKYMPRQETTSAT